MATYTASFFVTLVLLASTNAFVLPDSSFAQCSKRSSLHFVAAPFFADNVEVVESEEFTPIPPATMPPTELLFADLPKEEQTGNIFSPVLQFFNQKRDEAAESFASFGQA